MRSGARWLAGIAVFATAMAGITACGAHGPAVGTCGTVRSLDGQGEFRFKPTDCDDPGAAFRVVRESEDVQCPRRDETFEMRSRSRTARYSSYLCMELNATIGDCFIGLRDAKYSPEELSKEPCTEPGAYQVQLKTDAYDPQICRKSGETSINSLEVVHRKPAHSYCLRPMTG